MRILRIYKLFRHFAGLQALLYTLKQAYKELGLLLIIISRVTKPTSSPSCSVFPGYWSWMNHYFNIIDHDSWLMKHQYWSWLIKSFPEYRSKTNHRCCNPQLRKSCLHLRKRTPWQGKNLCHNTTKLITMIIIMQVTVSWMNILKVHNGEKSNNDG